MKRNTLLIALAVLLVAAFSMSGCTSCTRSEASSMMPVPSLPPEVSSVPLPPQISEPMEAVSSAISDLMDHSKPVMSADFGEIGALSAEKVKWGWGFNMDKETNRSVSCMGLQTQYGKYDADFIGPEEKKLYLTFDEGYENGLTPSLLDILKEKDVKAVFFVTYNYCEKNPDLVKRIIDEGHVLGNHSYRHTNFAENTPEQTFEEIKKLHDYIKETYNYDMSLVRCPEGEFNEQALAVAQQMGYRTSFWSFAYGDWDQNNMISEEKAKDMIMKYLHPGEIMLLHAVGSTNVKILADVIDTIRAEGYEILPYPGY